MSHSEINVLRTVPDPEVITYITDTPGVNKHESKEEQFVSVEDAEKGAFAPPPIALQRRLSKRHLVFIGFGGGIGTGLFVGTGAALALGGPLSLLISFSIAGFMIWGYIQSLGEVFTLFPSAGSLPGFASRFIDPAVGFALGWNYWYTFSLTYAAELVASALVIGYWSDLNPGIWITICTVPVIVLNLLSVRWYGNAEIATASIKVLTFVVLIITGIIIDLGGAPDGDRRGFRYWKNPGAMVGDTHLERFLGLFACFVKASFAYGGSETVILTAAECKDPSRQIPRAAKRVIYRILFFYIIGVLIVGMTVPSNDPNLLNGTGNAASSPFVIGMQRAGIKVLPHIINACILTSAWSAGNTYVYLCSRTLLGLSISGFAPKFLQRCSKKGIPYFCVGMTSLMGLLAYLCAGSAGSTKAFVWMINLTALSGLLAVATLNFAYIRFHRALRIQGIDRKSLPWRGPLQPFTAYFGIVYCFIITFFSGYSVFLKGNWDTATFISNYISYPIYFLPLIGYKLYKKTKFVNLNDVDLQSGRIDPADEVIEPLPTTKWGKFVDWLL